jgi:hypothetical protein
LLKNAPSFDELPNGGAHGCDHRRIVKKGLWAGYDPVTSIHFDGGKRSDSHVSIVGPKFKTPSPFQGEICEKQEPLGATISVRENQLEPFLFYETKPTLHNDHGDALNLHVGPIFSFTTHARLEFKGALFSLQAA